MYTYDSFSGKIWPLWPKTLVLFPFLHPFLGLDYRNTEAFQSSYPQKVQTPKTEEDLMLLESELIKIIDVAILWIICRYILMHLLEIPNIFFAGRDLFQPEFSPSKTTEKYKIGIIPKNHLCIFRQFWTIKSKQKHGETVYPKQ